MNQAVWIGTYTNGESRGIYRADFSNGVLRIHNAVLADNPSYLAVNGESLYAVLETENGRLASYQIDGEDGLRLTGLQRVLGDAPCHLCVDGRYIYVSNYVSGSLSVFELDGETAVHARPKVVDHGKEHGASPEHPHVHYAAATPDGAFVAVCDLGLNGVAFYPRESLGGIQEPGEWAHMPEGAGPRHAAFGKGTLWYVICELSCEVLTYSGYGASARLLQRQSLLLAGQQGSAAAAIRLSPDKTFLLASVRGADKLFLFDVLPDGALSLPRSCSAGGNWPRDAVFSPDGRYVLCACERDDRITVFRVHEGGLLFENAVSIPSPVCVCFNDRKPGLG